MWEGVNLDQMFDDEDLDQMWEEDNPDQLLGPLRKFNIYDIEFSDPKEEDYLGGDTNRQDELGRTQLHRYILNPPFDAEVMQTIIKKGANLELRTKSGKTPFVCSVILRHKKAMEVLIENGADVNAEDIAGNNALHYIVLPELLSDGYNFDFDDTCSILDRLLKEGVNVNAQNRRNKETPLMWAARGRHLPIVKKLLAFGANVFATDSNWNTPLHFAASNEWDVRCPAIISELVQNKACISCFNGDFRSPLACVLPDNNLAKELIRNAALFNWYKKIVFYTDHNRYIGYDGLLVNLSMYADLCYEEIDEMKKHILPGKPSEEKNAMERKILPHGSNLCEFARVGVSEDESRKTPEIKNEVFKILLKESFPLYLDLLLAKLGRQFLLQKGSILSIFTKGETEVVYLNSDIVHMICLFLENTEMLNLFSAFSDRFW